VAEDDRDPLRQLQQLQQEQARLTQLSGNPQAYLLQQLSRGLPKLDPEQIRLFRRFGLGIPQSYFTALRAIEERLSSFFPPRLFVVRVTPAAGRPKRRRGRRKGHAVAEATKVAAAALVLYFQRGGELPDSGRELARRAAELASELGLDGSDRLDPDGGAMKDLATALLEQLKKARAAGITRSEAAN
jgi:hypothetical protein